MSRRKKLWRQSVGIRPHTVQVFERVAGGPLTLRWWDPTLRSGQGNMRWRALGHRDPGQALAEAHEIAAKLKRGDELMGAGQTILAQLFLAYERNRTPRKSTTEQEADLRRIELWTRFLGADQAVEALTLEQWERFQDERSSGAIDARGRWAESEEGRRQVRARTVEADCNWLRLVVGWGTGWKDRQGRRLLKENPLRGFEVPKEKNPRRPVASTDRYETLRGVSDQVGELSELLDVVAGSGRRLSAVCQLRFDDLKLEPTRGAPYGAIRWRADSDKEGREGVVAIDARVRAAIDRVRSRRQAVGRAYLFPNPKDDGEPMPRYCADHWLRKAERLAGLESQEGSLWHAYRRAWATARKHMPLPDVAKAGGWSRGSRVLQEVYMQADDLTMLEVVLNPAEIREVSR